jgi:hypothetical protein
MEREKKNLALVRNQILAIQLTARCYTDRAFPAPLNPFYRK